VDALVALPLIKVYCYRLLTDQLTNVMLACISLAYKIIVVLRCALK